MPQPIPVALFAYARPAHLARALACLRENEVPLVWAFADGARGGGDEKAVDETRARLREVDWCDLRLVERESNFGLGRNVLTGITDVAAKHEAFIVWEDDLICVPGTYAWLCAALRHYAPDDRVMSISAWNHPRVTPTDIGDSPYFDGRAECWVWGAWSRSWKGMNEEMARDKMAAARRNGVAPDAYGADLPAMAQVEAKKNIWAVRWLYHHLAHGGLCLRPPWSMVEHIGFDAQATNAGEATDWANPPLRAAPPLPESWPKTREHGLCRELWREANPPLTLRTRLMARGRRALKVMKKSAEWATWWRVIVPQPARRWWRQRFGWRWFEGDYVTWPQARAAADGYDDPRMLARAVLATRAVRAGTAAWERDGMTFTQPAVNAPLLAVLRAIADEHDRRLKVVDFGGALGSTWWQHRAALADREVRWAVVEQPQFVAAGRKEFSDATLRFEPTLATACGITMPTVILFSSVLQYVEQPEALLREAMATGVRHLVIDRTPFGNGGRSWLTVQRTPPALGGGSYPAWVFDRTSLLAPLVAEFTCVAEWPGFDDPDPRMAYRGLHFVRKAVGA